MGAALQFFDHYNADGEDFLKSIVTGDETRILYNAPEMKQQSQQQMQTNSPRPTKLKQNFNSPKIVAIVFWDETGELLVQFVQPGTIINAHSYCETLQCLWRVIKKNEAAC